VVDFVKISVCKIRVFALRDKRSLSAAATVHFGPKVSATAGEGIAGARTNPRRVAQKEFPGHELLSCSYYAPRVLVVDEAAAVRHHGHCKVNHLEFLRHYISGGTRTFSATNVPSLNSRVRLVSIVRL
jgi:hypothetical protein